MNRKLSIQMTASLKDLEYIRSFIGSKSAEFSLDEENTYNLQLSVTELVTNSIVHGYKGEAGNIEIDVDQEVDKLIVRIRDEAPPFDPTQVPPPDLSLPLEERRFGGMGIFLIKQVVDEIRYKRLPQGGNEVILSIENKQDR